MKVTQRLDNIDFLRAVSIIFVLFYHYRPFAGEQLFKNGHYGVLLFFMISGYCIQFSAQSSSSAFVFLIKRWVRLLPALMFCSLLIFGMKGIFTEFNLNGHNIVTLDDLLKMVVNLPLIDAPILILNWFFDGHYGYRQPDSAFWSLLIELQFYFVVAFVMSLPKKLQYFSHLIILIIFNFVQIFNLFKFNLFYGLSYFYPYFLIGLAMAINHRIWRYLFIFSAFTTILLMQFFQVTNESIPFKIIPTCIALSFFILVVNKSSFFSRWGRSFRILGLISYPLYLIHQHIGQKILNFMGHYEDPSILKVILVITLMSVFAWIIYTFIETPIHKKVRGRLK